MAALTVNSSSLTGTAITAESAAAGGDTFANNGQTVLKVTNGGGSAITVTIDSLVNCNHGYDHDEGGSVAAGATEVFGPFPQSRFNDSSGNVDVSYSDVTSVTVEVISLV